MFYEVNSERGQEFDEGGVRIPPSLVARGRARVACNRSPNPKTYSKRLISLPINRSALKGIISTTKIG